MSGFRESRLLNQLAGMPRYTGPGTPLTAARIIVRIMSSIRSGSGRSPAHFVIDGNIEVCSTSWYSKRCRVVVGMVPLIAISGLEAQNASMIDGGKYVAPGPYCT